MPKPSQGIATAESSMRIEMSYLIQQGLIKTGTDYNSFMAWSNSKNSISYYIKINEVEKYLRLKYTQTDSQENKNEMDYKIYLEGIKSNLGKGTVYYFLCPVSNRKCRVLYLAYGSQYFKSRESYQNRIYYNCQRCSKRDYAHTRYFKLADKLEILNKTNFRSSYKGKETRSLKRIENLTNKVNYFDFVRFKQLEYYMKRKGYL